MSSGYYPPVVASTSTGSNTIAIIALILAIIAIVIIIIIAVLAFRNTAAVAGIIKDWTLVTASGSSFDFIAAPNTILQMPSSTAAGTVVNIKPFSGASSVITSGATTVFIIDNTLSDNDITVAPSSSIQAWPAGAGVASTTIKKYTSAEFYWLTPTTVSRLR